MDSFNRLVMLDQSGPVPIDGAFSIEENNDLVYNVRESRQFRSKFKLNKELRFKGAWRLTKDHNLELGALENKSSPCQGTLNLKSKIISADADSLAFEVSSIDKKGSSHLRLLKLLGTWRCDEKNRIIFTLKKEAQPNKLIFGTSWELDNNQQISYSYQKTSLKKKEKERHSFSFKGYWQVCAANKIAYVLSGDSDSALDFYVSIESPNLYPQEGVMKYRLGAGVKDAAHSKLIVLYGQWKFGRRAGLLFEMQYGKDGVHSLEFGIDLIIDKKDKVTFSLKDEQAQPLGINVIFSKKFLADSGEMFLRLNLKKGKPSVFGGIKIPF